MTDELIKDLREALYGPAQWGDTVLMSRAIDALTSQQIELVALTSDNDSLRKSLNGESEARCALEDEVKALRKIARFAGLVLREHRNDGYPGDVDGDFLQGVSVEAGLLEERRVESPCGSECSCSDIGEFPTICYFTTELGKAALSAASDGGGDE